MLFESIINHESHETDWFSCTPADVNNIRITVEIEDVSSSGEWLLKTHGILTEGSKVLNQLTNNQKRQWSFFFNPSSSRDTLFFDQYEQTRSKIDFMKIVRSQKFTKCRFIVQVVCIWSQGEMKGCIFEAVQVQFLIQSPTKSLFKFSKPFFTNHHVKKEEQDFPQEKYVLNTHVIKAKEHRVYGKFLKMIEMGIPIVAVNQKLVLSNIKITGGLETIQPNDPMPEEWKKTHDENVDSVIKDSILVPSLLGGTVLRSSGESHISRTEKKKKSDSSFTITLEQIASAIMSLRKTKFF